MRITEAIGYLIGATPRAAKHAYDRAHCDLIRTLDEIERKQANERAAEALRNIGHILAGDRMNGKHASP